MGTAIAAPSTPTLDDDAITAAVDRIRSVQDRAHTRLVQVSTNGDPIGCGDIDLDFFVRDIVTTYLRNSSES